MGGTSPGRSDLQVRSQERRLGSRFFITRRPESVFRSRSLFVHAMSEIRLFDCFTFNDELDLLELRLQTSAPHVDFFVLVEAAKTFSGAGKPLHFKNNQSRFAQYREKLRHVVVTDLPPPAPRRWEAEVSQRNSLVQGLDGARAQDIVLVSDADELIHPQVLATLRQECSGLTGLQMRSTFRFANWELPLGPFAQAARAMPFRQLHNPHHQRNHEQPEHVIRDAGRHFTSLGDVQDLVAKFENYSHSEMDNSLQKSTQFLARAQKMGLDVFSRQLVSVLGRAELSPIQRELLKKRPDLFNFSELPGQVERNLFRWYANWRARQPATSKLVRELDFEYDQRRSTIASKAGIELSRYATRTIPRRSLGAMKRQLAKDAVRS